jgi:hypothetical protein
MSTERLLKLVGPIHIIGGLLLTATGFLPAAQSFLEALYPESDRLAWSPFFVAVFGPTVASWGLLFGVIVSQFYDKPSKRLWRALLASLIIWAPLDSILCIYYGFFIGVVINAIVFFSVGALLLIARQRIE